MWVQVPWHDPHTVYSEYQFGSISRFDLRTGEARRHPAADTSTPARRATTGSPGVDDAAPALAARFDGALRRRQPAGELPKRGDDWELLGPDMTRANRERPEPENGSTSYHAIFSIAESPRTRACCGRGATTGLIWLTRDGGTTWAEVGQHLPADAPRRCFVGTLVASRHAEGWAYAALDCHHRDDYRPYLYRTTDYGASWTPIMSNLPATAGRTRWPSTRRTRACSSRAPGAARGRRSTGARAGTASRARSRRCRWSASRCTAARATW
jgi:hypothetical protein